MYLVWVEVCVLPNKQILQQYGCYLQMTVQDQGVQLASNQVQYSLLYRASEQNGVLKACQELGVTLIAYSPLCQGLLTGTCPRPPCPPPTFSPPPPHSL